MYDGSMICRLRASVGCAVLVGAVIALASGTSTAAIPGTLSPARAAVTASQSQQFTAHVTGDPQSLGVAWSVDGVPGGNANSGTIGSTGSFTPGQQFGVHTVTATSVADSTK